MRTHLLSKYIFNEKLPELNVKTRLVDEWNSATRWKVLMFVVYCGSLVTRHTVLPM